MPEPRVALVTGATAGLGRAARAHQGTYDPAVRSRLRALTAELLAPAATPT